MNVDVTTRGAVASEMAALANEKLGDLESVVQRPITGARAVLQQEQNPRIPRAARAEAEIHVGGHPIRGRVEAESMEQAINDLTDRLRQQLRRHADRLADRKRGTAGIAEAAWTPPRPPESWREPGEREVIRRKTFALEPIDAIQAAADMSSLDHDFFLFHDIDTDADSMLYRRDDGRLAVLAPQDAGASDGAPEGPVRETSRYSEPLELAVAVSEMDELNHRFLFFTDASTDRGAVLYLRYDGHYGLIEPGA